MEFFALTKRQPVTIVGALFEPTKYSHMADSQLKSLEKKIDELIDLCAELNRENQALKSQHADWHHERQSLVQKNELARTKVEGMIERLRSLEQET